MIAASGTCNGIDWYIKVTGRSCYCVYLDTSGHPCVENRQGEEQDYDFGAPHGITYATTGLREDGFETVYPDHWFIGWDYAHDMRVLMREIPPPTYDEIISDIKHVTEEILAFESRKST